jgi:uncharacterized protein YlxW (UPF0749 family)
VASRRGWTVWRALVPVTVAAAAVLLVTSAQTARGTDLRASRTLQLNQLIQRQQRSVGELADQAARLRAQIKAADALATVGDRRVAAARAAAARLSAPAGLTAVRGPAVTVTLDDAPRGVQRRDLAAGARPDDLVIHQQDVQGVVNALWAGGAEAMTIMGERVVATTAVRCVGNTLLLHGQVFSPPFVVTAIGEPQQLRSALASDPDVQVFQQYVVAYGLRYHESTAAQVRLPAYRGGLQLDHAKAAT